MFKRMMNTKLRLLKNQKGLTLVELLAVIVILGVVAAIAVPAIGGIINNSKINADAQTVVLLQDTAVRYLTDTDADGSTAVTTVAVATLETNHYLRDIPLRQSGATAGAAYASVTVAYTAATGWTAGAVQ
ncbi:hypothetical protein ASG89_06615 [Paenibacillus sp. Soil766]|uniref:type II secretion system protein n=1 Tax=Paenibacillus sp. Soil766 TaxID=1736404 RepID=UPI0007089D2C|nr:prepilin-type N-terminal cleavage/methylation domain-containing protein [Paenibacillus sp. Soil766]KRE93172.1 hypothetical protein ASG89_06615 [Paenibacillus sp. Soil766]